MLTSTEGRMEREELKNLYIETCMRIGQMQREAAAAAAEWRKLLKEARRKRDALLSRIANTDAGDGTGGGSVH